MTIIEFFDRSVIKNVANALLCKPDRVITVGHDVRLIYESYNYLLPLMDKIGKKVDLVPMKADRNNLQEIINVLKGIVEQYDDCIFDLTGGEDLYLVAVGSVMASSSKHIQCHRFDFKKKKLIDCDADGLVCGVDNFNVSIDDIIALHGGKIVDEPYDKYYQEPWVLDEELHQDVEDICHHTPDQKGQGCTEQGPDKPGKKRPIGDTQIK